MKTVIAGGTGFLGRPLGEALTRDGHTIVILSRKKGDGGIFWDPNGESGPWRTALAGADAVVNLAGESIAAKRWTPAQKEKILDSRLRATSSLVKAIAQVEPPPRVFISGSAVGYYGPLGDEVVTEDQPAGDDFLAHVCRDWEAEAMRATTTSPTGVRVVRIRTGLVLARDGGALPKMLPPFWMGAGGPVGNGRQYWPWIHRKDWIELVRWIIRTPSVDGAINLTAPAPVNNATFGKALGRAMHRPAFMPAPALALRLLLGEMADALLLSGQRAVPAKAERLGYQFTFREVDSALRNLFAG